MKKNDKYLEKEDKSQGIHKKILALSEEKTHFHRVLTIRHNDFCDEQYFELKMTLRFGILVEPMHLQWSDYFYF